MKIRFFYFAALSAAAMGSIDPLQATVLRNGGDTTVSLLAAFGIYLPPSRITVPPTEHVTVLAPPEVPSDGSWSKDGTIIPGTTGRALVIESAQPSDNGIYQYHFRGLISEAGLSQPVFLNVRPATSLVNLSTRGFAGQGDQTLIGGFVVAGKSDGIGPSTILLRAVGPTLTRFGVNGVLKAPKISIFSADGKPYTTEFVYPLETGYITREQHLQAVTTKVGAFALDPGAKDAVELRPFLPGLYTVHVTGADGSGGIVLVETYESPD